MPHDRGTVSSAAGARDGEASVEVPTPLATATPPAPGPAAAPPPGFGAIGRQAAFYALGTILGRAISFVTLPFYTRLLTPAEYGVIQLVLMTFELVAMVAGSRLAAGVFRFYHKAESREEKNRVMSTAAILISACYVVASILAALLAEPLSILVFDTPEWAGLLRIAALSFAAQGLLVVPILSYRAFDQPLAYVTRGVSQQIFQAGLNITFLTVFGMGVYSVFTSSAIVMGLYGVVLLWVLLRKVGLSYSASIAADLWRYGLPLIVTQAAVFIMTLGGRYVLQHSAGSTAVGLYSLAGTFATILVQFGNMPFMLVWESERFKIAEHPERDSMYARAFVVLNIMLLSVAVGIGLLVRDFLAIMADPSYWPAAGLVPIVLGAYILQCWTMSQDVGILLTERTRYIAVANWVASGVAVAGFLLLIPRYEAYGAAWATFLAFAVRWMLTYHYSQKLEFVQYRWSPVLKLVVAGGVIVATGYMLPELPKLLSLAASGVLFLTFVAFTWYGRVLTEGEREAIVALGTRLGSSLTDALSFARSRG